MLSGETAKGSYPIQSGAFRTSQTPSSLVTHCTPNQSVLMMAETCYLAESAICYPPLYDELRATTSRPTDTVETVAMAAVGAAIEQNAGAILVLSTSGNTARLISKFRPNVPIVTGTLLLSLTPLPRFKLIAPPGLGNGGLTYSVVNSQSPGTSRQRVRSICTGGATHFGTLNRGAYRPASGRSMWTTESGASSQLLLCCICLMMPVGDGDYTINHQVWSQERFASQTFEARLDRYCGPRVETRQLPHQYHAYFDRSR